MNPRPNSEAKPGKGISVTADCGRAVAALAKLRGGLFRVGAIDPNVKGFNPVCRTYDLSKPEEAMKARKFLHHQNVTLKRNVYFEPGVPKRRKDKKSSESDIASIEFQLADCDPLPGETADEAKTRIYKELASDKVPKPSFTWESGNGVLVGWRRKEPIKLNSPGAIARTKAINAGLRDALGGKKDAKVDDCISLDHLFRVPHTINYPDAKKRAAGREICLSGNVKFYSDRTYLESAFPGAKVAPIADPSKVGDALSVDLAELNISKRLRDIIETGESTIGDPPNDNSPSGWRMSLICGLKREGISSETTLGILLDRDNMVSAERAAKAGSREAAETFFKKEIAKAIAMNAESVRNDFDGAESVDDYDDSEPDPAPPKEAENPMKRERFKGRRYSELKNAPSLKYTLDQLIPVNSVFCLFGNENAGKTFWAVALGLSIACGLPDFHGVAVRSGKVIHVIGEGSERAFGYRVEAWIRMTAKMRDDVTESELRERIETNWEFIAVPVTVNSSEEVAEFLKVNRPEGRRALVILDTLMRNFSGDINAQVDMMAFVRGADLIKRKTGATVLILHHPGLKEVNRPAGSRSLAGSVDGMARLFELDGKRVFKLVKLRDGDVNKPPVSYALESVEVDFSFEDPDVNLTSAFLNAADQPTSDSDDSILMQIHQSKPRSQTDIRVECIKTKSAMQRRIDKLRKAGMIERDTLALTTKGILRVRNVFPDDGISDDDGTMD